MKKIIEWLKSIHSSGTPESAKRFYGGIVFAIWIANVQIQAANNEINK